MAMAMAMVEGEIDALAGFEAEQFDMLIDDVHPSLAGPLVGRPFGQALQGQEKGGGMFGFLRTCFKIGFSHDQLPKCVGGGQRAVWVAAHTARAFTLLSSRHQPGHLRAFDKTVRQGDQRLLIFVRK